MNKIRKLFINIVLLTIAMCALFLLSEAATRLILPTSVKLRLMHKPDKELGFRLVPNYHMEYETSDSSTSISVNSEGLRDHEYPKGKAPPDTFRILAVGDSFTFGLGVDIEESYPKVLEAMLNRSPLNRYVRKYEVVNAGVDGYGPEQEYLYLKELLNRYRPDLVIVGLYSNDVNDVMSGIPLALTKSELKNRFYFLSYLSSLRILVKRLFIDKRDIKKDLFEIYQDQHPPAFEKALKLTEEYLVRIRDTSGSMGAKTVIIIIPSCFEVDRSEWEKRGLGSLYSNDFFNRHMTKFSDTFREFGETTHIATLPLLPVLRKSETRPLYLTRDSHWNRKGHRLAAKAIYNYLKKEVLTRD